VLGTCHTLLQVPYHINLLHFSLIMALSSGKRLLFAAAGLSIAQSSFVLPSHLALLDPSDPRWPYLNATGTNFTLAPGKGGLREFAVVYFTTESYVYRAYGGNASMCGYWWAYDSPEVSWDTYASEYAICPEFNSGEFIRRCDVPNGTALVVGPGQSVLCSAGNTLYPKPDYLQLVSSDIRSNCLNKSESAGCKNCTANQALLSQSSCLNGPDPHTPVAAGRPSWLTTGVIVGIIVGAAVVAVCAAALILIAVSRSARECLWNSCCCRRGRTESTLNGVQEWDRSKGRLGGVGQPEDTAKAAKRVALLEVQLGSVPV
jgi:hypothetical protein